MGGAAQAVSAMKYHYFHGRFTYSVKRNGRSSGAGSLTVFRPVASRLILVLKREPSREESVGEAELNLRGFAVPSGAVGSRAGRAELMLAVTLREFIRWRDPG